MEEISFVELMKMKMLSIERLKSQDWIQDTETDYAYKIRWVPRLKGLS